MTRNAKYLRHLGYTVAGLLTAWVALYITTLFISTNALHISVEVATWLSHQVSFAAVYLYTKTHPLV